MLDIRSWKTKLRLGYENLISFERYEYALS